MSLLKFIATTIAGGLIVGASLGGSVSAGESDEITLGELAKITEQDLDPYGLKDVPDTPFSSSLFLHRVALGDPKNGFLGCIQFYTNHMLEHLRQGPHGSHDGGMKDMPPGYVGKR